MSSTTTSTTTTTPISYKDAAAKSLKMNSPYYHQNQQQGSSPSSTSPNGTPSPTPAHAQQQFPSGPNPYPQTFQGLPFPQQAMTPQQQQQFAQWAYQQMMFQQQQLAFQPHAPVPFMTPQQMQVYQQQLLQQQQQFQQFPPQPPYARERNGSAASVHSSSGGSVKEHRRQRTTSNRSNPNPGSNSNNARTRTNSTGRSVSPAPPQGGHRHRVSSSASSRTGSNPPSRQSSATASSATTSATKPPSKPNTGSPSSNAASSNNSLNNAAAANKSNARPPAKPSPLSQGSTSGTKPPPPKQPAPVAQPVAAEPTPAMLKSGGLKGRLKRALSFSALDEHSASPNDPKIGSRKQAVNAKLAAEAIPRSSSQPLRPSMDAASTVGGHSDLPSSSSTATTTTLPVEPSEGSIRSTTTATAPKKRSLFNSKFNRSTDNMSMASTASSASMMIRKLGSVGKLVRRNSLMGISKMFKKDQETDGEAPGGGTDAEESGGKKKKKDKGRKLTKSAVAEPSVSHATVEQEPPSPAIDGDETMAGLSPAAKLARAHTLRSRAAEAAKAAEASAASAAANANGNTPTTWEKNTATRAGGSNGARRSVNDMGGQGWGPSDDELSEDDTFDAHQPQQQWREQAQDDDSDEDDYGYGGYDEEDETVRLDGPGAGNAGADEEGGFEPWAVGLRRSVERIRTPVKGILRNGDGYSQNSFLEGGPPQAPFTRVRTNSNDSAPPMGAEPGPLTHIPSPDPDHIDGLHRSNSGSDRHSHHSRKLSTSSSNSGAAGAFLPAFNFGDESIESTITAISVPTNAKKDRPLSSQSAASIYANADFNASAPALHSNVGGGGKPNPPQMTLRSATVPLAKSKKLTFAANLSVYHTFSPSSYDRRSEPATCNRLTPVLAQRIKEELNSYKMEEMEVHPTSRAHTHFFV